MTDDPRVAGAGQAPLDTATRLALQQTNLALERTTMAWIRTSTSLIAFGFTIFKFFEYRAAELKRTVVSPWIVGMIMISVGMTALILAWVQHRRESATLRAQDPDLPYSLAGIMAAMIAILGLVALVVVGWRL